MTVGVCKVQWCLLNQELFKGDVPYSLPYLRHSPLQEVKRQSVLEQGCSLDMTTVYSKARTICIHQNFRVEEYDKPDMDHTPSL
ncbi:hypothetical protein DAPPUDRAFT_257634 [Daphnia pulex]|uniref:Uncharacterized protein n=1 Tax=Daphnia pulex TaxID=6669 RepID=E9HDY3_DAPPU|nr:hypothetical protein DAPPUDRAFT_257634 [Daphnia pulex]|eukprot:EFX70052.1 hypothetical protein DAPPUDRAFT_257634 [Daphnia pulex]